MIKIHKEFLIFVAIAIGLGVVTSIGLQKFSPLFLHPTIYYCQKFIHSFSTKVPSITGILLVSILLVFVLSIIGKLLWQARKIHVYRKKLIAKTSSSLVLHTLLKKLAIQKDTFLVDDIEPFAFCFGIRHPKIYVSTALLALMNEQEIEAILLHESYHLRQRDTVTMLIASVLQSLFFFFPLFSDMLHNYRIEQEVKADQSAVNFFGTPHILISALTKLITVPTKPALALSAIADEDTLEARIHALGNTDVYRKKFHLKHIALSLVSVVILFGIIFAPLQVEAITMQNMDEQATMVCPYGHECASWCRDHKTVLPYSPVPKAKNYSGK